MPCPTEERETEINWTGSVYGQNKQLFTNKIDGFGQQKSTFLMPKTGNM